MRIFSQGILARRKIVFIFLLAILLPSLIIGYLSFSTFAQRRESVRRLLESNLWISGESALKSIESELLEHEKKALKSENFTRLTELKDSEQILSDYSKLSKEIEGQLFLLNAEYQIIIPKTGKEDISIFPGEKNVQNTEFAQALKQAESLEFSGKNYSRAAELYRKCYSLAPTNQHKALALEALGRCLLSLKKYREAYKVYSELSAKYGQFLNNAGHPYGILAAFQQYEIERRRKREENSLKILLSLYGKIRNGVWLINLEWTREQEASEANMLAAHNASIRIVVGTDYSIFLGFIAVHWEMEFLVETGFSPLEALRAATQDAAATLGLEGQLGIIAQGAIADLVVLEADPREDIRNTQKIHSVIKDGNIVDRDALLKEMQK